MSLLDRVEEKCFKVGFKIKADDLYIFGNDFSAWDKKFNFFLGVSDNYLVSLADFGGVLFVYLQIEAEIIVVDKKGNIVPTDIPDSFIDEAHTFNLNREGVYVKLD